jgi:hypothetical protein
MKLNVTGLFASDATTTDPHRDGSNLNPGAHVWKTDIDGYARRAITVTYDNGTYYEYVEGHVDLHGSNDRSSLFLNRP